MEWVCWALAILTISAAATWTNRGRYGIGEFIGVGGCLAGGAMGMYGAGHSLLLRLFESRRGLWNAPFTSFALGLDSLSAVFIMLVMLTGMAVGLAAIRRQPGEFSTNRPHEHWLYLNSLMASAGLLLVARNAVLLLFAWQAMTVIAFLLVEGEQRAAGAKSGGWPHFLHSQCGWLCLAAAFLLMMRGPNLDFAALGASDNSVHAVFLLGFAAFCARTGMIPFQNWLPDSCSRAAASTGALVVCVGGNAGLYCLLRLLVMLGGAHTPPWWWGALLVGVGAATGVLMVVRMRRENDLYRMLGLSSSALFGLVCAGAGAGLLGVGFDAGISYLAFTAVLFLALGHTLGKTLLFLTAGAIHARTGTRMLANMGGLWRRMRFTGVFFLLGSAGAGALPPLSGFIGLFLLAKGAGAGLAAGATPLSLAVVAAAVLCLVVAAGCGWALWRTFASLFLGEPRGPGAVSGAGDNRWHMIPHIILACLSVYAVVTASRLVRLFAPTAEFMAKLWLRAADAGGSFDAGVVAPGDGYLALTVATGALFVFYVALCNRRMGRAAPDAAPARAGEPAGSPAKREKRKRKRKIR